MRFALVAFVLASGCARAPDAARPSPAPPSTVTVMPTANDGGGAPAFHVVEADAGAAPFDEAAVVTWRPDGRALAVAWGARAAIVPVDDGEPVALAPASSTHEVLAFSPDGQRLASIGHDGAVRLFAADGTLAGQLFAGDAGARDDVASPSLAFSADGARLVVVTDRARVWEVATRAQVCVVADGWIADVVFQADGRSIAGSSLTGAFGRWDAARCTPIDQGSADTGGTFGTSLSPDGRWLASSEQGHGLRIHLLEKKGERPIATPTTTCRHHVAPAFAQDGKTLVVLADWFRSYRVPGFTPLASWSPKPAEREAIVQTFDDGLHVLVQDERHTAVVDVRTPAKEVRVEANGITRFVPSPDSAWLAGIAKDGVHVWSATTGKPVRTVAPP